MQITKITIEVDGPMNDITDNAKLLLGSFPHLFPTGEGIMTQGSLPTPRVRHLLTQYDHRFARDHHFLFLLYNQAQRHSAAKAVTAKVKSGSREMIRFCELVNAPTFEERLGAAVRHPDSEEAHSFMQSIVGLLRVTGRQTLYNPAKKGAICKLYGSVVYFGMPSIFVTMAPSDTNSLLREQVRPIWEETMLTLKFLFLKLGGRSFLKILLLVADTCVAHWTCV